MKYSASWKILAKNLWIRIVMAAGFVLLLFNPIRTSVSALTKYSNVALYEITSAFLYNTYIWFALIFFMTFELILQIKNSASQILWVSSKKETCKAVLKFSMINTGMLSLAIIIFESILFAIHGKGHTAYLFRIISDVFFYYFLTGMIAAVVAVNLSFIKKAIAGAIIGIVVIVLSGPFFDMTGIFVNLSFQRPFEIMPQFSNYAYDIDSGFHISAYSMGLIVFWLGMNFLILMVVLKDFAVKKLVPAVLVAAFGLFVALMPSVSRFGSSNRMNYKDALYLYGQNYRNVMDDYEDNETALEKARFKVTKYEMDLKAGWDLSNTVKMWVDNSNLENYVFTLYSPYEIKSVEDQKGNALEYTRSGDNFAVKGNGDVESVTVTYKGSAAPSIANYDAVRLCAGFPWYPYPGEQHIYSYEMEDEYGMLTFGFCKNNEADYVVKADSIYELYADLEKDGNSFEGKTDSLVMAGGMVAEDVKDNINYVYPIEMDYSYRNDNGIADWEQYASEMMEAETSLKNNGGDVYCFYGNWMAYRNRDAGNKTLAGSNYMVVFSEGSTN